jgi:hypothetical protein
MKTAWAWIHSDGHRAVLLLVMVGNVGLPIQDEAVFLFVGYQSVQAA